MYWIGEVGGGTVTLSLSLRCKNTLLSVRTTWATPRFIGVTHSVSSSAVYRVFARLSQDCLSYSSFVAAQPLQCLFDPAPGNARNNIPSLQGWQPGTEDTV